MCRSCEVQVIQNVQFLWHTGFTKMWSSYQLGFKEVCRSYELRFIQKRAYLMGYLQFKSVLNLRGTGDTKVCRSFEVKVMQKCAHLFSYRYTKLCRSYELQVIQKCASLMSCRWYKSVRNLWGEGDTQVYTSVHTSEVSIPAACVSDFWAEMAIGS